MDYSSDLDIRSETQVALTEFTELTERSIRTPNIRTHQDTVILHTRRRNYPIKCDNFAQHSEKIRKLLQRNGLPPSIDLSCYNIDAVRTLTDFLAGVDPRNLRLGTNILPDLLQLARIFRMKQLTDHIVKYVIDKVENGTAPSLLLALHLFSMDWSLFLKKEATYALLQTAAENIKELIASNFFNILPAAVLVILFSRCDVSLSSELELTRLFIRWVMYSPRSRSDVEILFTCVRSAFLSDSDRVIIRNSLSGLPLNIVELIETVLYSPRNHRCCLIKAHITRRMPRCGIPDNSRYTRVEPIVLVVKPETTKKSNQTKLVSSSSEPHLVTAKLVKSTDVVYRANKKKHEAVGKGPHDRGSRKSARYYACRSTRQEQKELQRHKHRNRRSSNNSKDHHV